jgi:hypothetical protein
MPCTGNDHPNQQHERQWRYRLNHWAIQHAPLLLLDNPWGLLVKGACVAAGAAILFVPGVPIPTTVAEVLSGPWARAWAFLLFLGGSAGIAGYTTRLWRVENAGLFMVAAGSLAYAIIIANYFGPSRSVLVWPVFVALSLSALLRALKVYLSATAYNHRRKLEEYRADGPT